MIDFDNYDFSGKPNIVAWRMLEKLGKMGDGDIENVNISDFEDLDSHQMIEVVEILDDVFSQQNTVQLVDRIGKLLTRAASEHGDEAEFIDNLDFFDTAALMAHVSHETVEILRSKVDLFKSLTVLFLSISIILLALLLFW